MDFELSPELSELQASVRRLAQDTVAIDGVTPEHVGPLLATNQIVLYELSNQGADLESIFLELTSGLGFGDVSPSS